jgi:hypothetical protein
MSGNIARAVEFSNRRDALDAMGAPERQHV